MIEKITLDTFLERYNNSEVCSFSIYKTNKKLTVRVRTSKLDHDTVELDTDEEKLKFKEWIDKEISNVRLLSNNCYYLKSELKIHFYVIKNMKFNLGKTLLSECGRDFREVPACTVDLDWLKKFIG